MSREAIVFAAGLHSLGFALFHLAFWKLFDWPAALRRTNAPTRAIAQILNLRLVYVLLGIAALCFFLPRDLLDTRLGHAILAGMSLFWVGRTIEQFVFLRIDHALVYGLTLAFFAGSVLFAWPLFAGG